MDQPEMNENMALAPPPSHRVQKVQTKQPPIPLTEAALKSQAVLIWFESAHAYLSNDAIQLKSWVACITTWVAFEKENGSLNTTSVS